MSRARLVAAAALALGLALAAPAAAQDQDIGGDVPSLIGLDLSLPEGFDSFPAGPGEHELAIRARVTSTDAVATLSVADGDAASGRSLGHLTSGASTLDAPIEARIGSTAFLPLDAAVEEPLAVLRRPVANETLTIRLRQRVQAGERPRGTYSKTLLVTLSSETP